MAKRLNDLFATVLQWFYAHWRKFWCAIRQLSGDDAYERYLAHHTATTPLSRKEFFQHEQQQKWSTIKRCC